MATPAHMIRVAQALCDTGIFNEKEEEFLDDLLAKLETQRDQMRLSEKQLHWLTKLYDRATA